MDKREIVEILKEISILYELKGENFFKIRAYQAASRALEVSDIDINKNTSAEELISIKGIGASIAGQISALAKEDTLKLYEKLKQSIPPGLLDMLKIPGLGPKRIKYLYDTLGIKDIVELEYACIENKLASLPNFGEKTQKNILHGIDIVNKFKESFLYAKVIDEALKIQEKLKKQESVIRCSIAGSLRRKKEIVKDIDIVASTKNSKEVMNFFTGLKEASEIISEGETKSSIRLNSGVNADIRTVSDFQFPYALHHFTGSKEHNTEMRSLAKKRNMKMNEYGLFKDQKLIKCGSEEDIFAEFGMAYIEPELRENTGEIEAAQNKKLPLLVKEDDIKGLFHFHTVNSDGKFTLKQAADELISKGFKYCGVADHSKTASYAGGIKEDSIMSYLSEIDLLNKEYKDFKIFKGIESDILPDGSLDYSDEILEKFDFVIIAVHSNFNMNAEQMTGRIIKAMHSRYAVILAHPTGRLLLSREPYEVNIGAIIEAAAKLEVAIEINASPYRLDLDWRHCRNAKEKGVKFFINPDAHSLEALNEYRFGVNIARKGWLEKNDIINTLPLEDIEKYFLKKKALNNTRHKL